MYGPTDSPARSILLAQVTITGGVHSGKSGRVISYADAADVNVELPGTGIVRIRLFRGAGLTLIFSLAD